MRYLILGTLVILLFTLAPREAEAQPRTCVRADVAEPFVLPDGSSQSAGLLRICLERNYSPVAGLHTVSAGGHAGGRYLSRRVHPEAGPLHAPQLAFVRNRAGVLVLRGYTLARGGDVEAYWLEAPRGTRTPEPEALIAQAPVPPTVWLAAVVSR